MIALRLVGQLLSGYVRADVTYSLLVVLREKPEMTHVRTALTRRLAGVGMVVLSAVAVAVAAAPTAIAEGQVLGTENANAIKDSYIVVLADGATPQGVQAAVGTLAAKHGATVEHTYQHAVRGFAGTMTRAAARALAADPAVARVEQNGTVSLVGTQPNPPSWGLDRIDQRDLPLNSSYTYPNTASNVRAYIIDTGIRVTHQDFGGRAGFGTNTVGDGNNTDCNGHGTHVAGTVGGAAYGVAKGVQLTAVKVLGCTGSGSFAGVIAGVDWVTGHHTSGPAVANMSLGGTGTNITLENAVRASIADGVVYALASGNSNSDACNFTPARTPEAITVNATAINDSRASFSNYGTCSDIFAPGVNITSAWYTSDSATNTISGTSMASPHVAGGAALILGANGGLTPQQVANSMYANSAPNKVTDPGPGSPNRLLSVGAADPEPPANDTLVPGQSLRPDESLKSQNGAYTLIMQGDGNLVLYNQASQPLWHTGTAGYPGASAVFQGDGNFVVYTGSGVPLWHTHTHGTAASRFVVQNDSNIVIYGPSGQVFGTDSDGAARFALLLATGLDDLDDDGQDRDQDDEQDHRFEVFVHERDLAEEVTQHGDAGRPQHGADRGVDEELPGIHPADAGDGGDERPHHGHESRQHDRARAVLLEEDVRLDDVFPLEQLRVRLVEQGGSGLRSDPVSDDVADERAHRQQQTHQPQWRRDDVLGHEQTCGEQQRVAGKEEAEQQPALGEDDQTKPRQQERSQAGEDDLGIQPGRQQGEVHGKVGAHATQGTGRPRRCRNAR